ncbi:MAG TPA: prepilin-type N-terminal cleavage/methylation domain-containing protein, partial [Bacilli bacterium]|nr:prepilin-type N-terminal cleavage/methylation domain-containing protein [Bacilli bacterium]
MKKNKGFTLIELMATILILGVISLIAVLIINNIIRTVKQEAFRDSTYGYVKAASNYYVVEDGKGNFSAKTIKYTNKKADLNILNLQSQSYVPDEGKLEIAEDEKIAVAFYDQSLDMCAYKNTEEDKVNLVSVNNPSECTFNGKKKLPEGKDITGLCNDSLSYADTTNYQILNVEGLVCFSQQVDSGKDFNGKVVKQVSNIDIKNKDSYENDKTKKYGDINENGIEEDLYTELNTEKGFNPIGKNTNNYKFAGTYEGYGYELRNLYINRPSEDYIGLFAYNEGLIRGMNIYDIDINGYNVVGGIAGHNNNTGVINEIKITGDIIGYTQVGGAVGVSASAITTSILANTNITSTYPSSGSVSMGGIVGSHYYG